MASLNKFMGIGNLTREPELRYLPNGDAVANLSIAINESYKDKSGNKVEKAEFVNIVAYRNLAEIMGEYLKKGSSVYIEGRLQTRKWEKDGVTRYSTEIIADSMQMLGGKADGSTGRAQRQDSKPNEQEKYTHVDQDGDVFSDSIPF